MGITHTNHHTTHYTTPHTHTHTHNHVPQTEGVEAVVDILADADDHGVALRRNRPLRIGQQRSVAAHAPHLLAEVRAEG